MLVSPLASSTSPATIFIGQEPSCALGAPGTRRSALGGLDLPADEQRHRRLDVVPDVDRARRRVHGTAPSGSCTAAIEAAVWATCGGVEARRAPTGTQGGASAEHRSGLRK